MQFPGLRKWVRLSPCDVEDDEGADGLLVVDASHVAEALLAGDVPQLEKKRTTLMYRCVL